MAMVSGPSPREVMLFSVFQSNLILLTNSSVTSLILVGKRVWMAALFSGEREAEINIILCKNKRSTRHVNVDKRTQSDSLFSISYPCFGSPLSSASVILRTPFTDTWSCPPMSAPHAVHLDLSIGMVHCPTEYLCPLGQMYQPTCPDAFTISMKLSSGTVRMKDCF